MVSGSRRKLPLVAAFSAVIFIGLLAAACGESGDSEASRDAQVLNAINILDNAGLHGYDESINDNREIPADARTKARQLQAVTAITEWPDDLQDEAEALEAILAEFAAALDGDNPDIARAGEAAKKAHDAQHDFSLEVWAYLYEQGGVETAEGDGGH